MKGRSNSLTTNASSQEVMQTFLNFCKRRSKRAMSPKTLDRYGQVIDVLFRKYGLHILPDLGVVFLFNQVNHLIDILEEYTGELKAEIMYLKAKLNETRSFIR
jgi:hypothetical protein